MIDRLIIPNEQRSSAPKQLGIYAVVSTCRPTPLIHPSFDLSFDLNMHAYGLSWTRLYRYLGLVLLDQPVSCLDGC